MYPLILVGLVILFFLPRYWLLVMLVVVSIAFSGIALYDAWSGAQALRTADGQPPLADALFWQSRSLSEALMRQLAFVVVGAVLVMLRKAVHAARARTAGDNAATTSAPAPAAREIAGEGSAPQGLQTEPRAPAAEVSAPSAPPAPRDWRRGFKRLFVVLSAIWWVVALSLSLPPMMEEFPDRNAVEIIRIQECERELEDNLEFQAWRSAEPPISRARETRAVWDQWVARNPCHARVLSPAVKQEIDAAHRANVAAWSNSLLLMLAFIVLAPFAAALVSILAWRTYRWVGEGFRPGV